MSFGPYYCEGTDITSEQLITLGQDRNKFRVDSTDPEFRLSKKVPVIDVVSDFVWTASPVKESKDTIPVMYLTELRQAQNSIVSSALYYINAFTNSPISNDAQQALDWLTTKIVGAPSATGETDTDSIISSLKKRVEDLINSGADSQLLG